MATLDDIQKMWRVDCVIGDDLGRAAIECPMLHSKYLDELINAKLKLTKITHEIAELKTIKSKYFRGEMTQEELMSRGWTQWQYKSLKADIGDLIEGDADYQKIQARESYMRTTISALESIMAEIKNRNWAIKASIDWQKFRSGA